MNNNINYFYINKGANNKINKSINNNGNINNNDKIMIIVEIIVMIKVKKMI